MPKNTFSRPRDKSLEAYKKFVQGITRAINPDAKSTMTDEQWVAAWKKFWSKANDAADNAKDESTKES